MARETLPRFRAWNNLHQPHLARGVEEVGAEESGGEFLRSPLDQSAYGQSRGIGADDRRGSRGRFDPLEQRALRIELFNDRFDHPIGVAKGFQVIKPQGPYAIGKLGNVKRWGAGI